MPRVGLLDVGFRWIRELRKWNLAPLGAVLAVVLLGAGVITMLTTGGEPSPEELVRKYFASPAGGGAPPERARLIHVNDCQQTSAVARGEVIYKCTVVFGNNAYSGCFAWNGSRVVIGSRQLGYDLGCTPLSWGRNSATLISG